MNDARRVKTRSELESLVNTLKDNLELFVETGGSDRSMCNGVRSRWTTSRPNGRKSAKTSHNFWQQMLKERSGIILWRHRHPTERPTWEVSRDLEKQLPNSSIQWRRRGWTGRHRTLEDKLGEGGGGARGGAPPRVDESLRPNFKGSYGLSLNEFNRWQEMANAWGLASMHEQRPPLVQKMYFKQITEKEFSENCNLGGTCTTFQHYVEESKIVYNKRVSIFLRRNEYMEATRVEDEGYISYYHQLRKLSEMADIKTMREKDWIMHSVMTSLPTNVFKQITTTTINPVLEDVLGTLEVVEQQMRQLTALVAM